MVSMRFSVSSISRSASFKFFFFQAEDGIRDVAVTGVQTCALPICYIQVIENGRAVMRLCVQPVECLPDADVVVLHKLMIEANEENYLQKANKYLCIEIGRASCRERV